MFAWFGLPKSRPKKTSSSPCTAAGSPYRLRRWLTSSPGFARPWWVVGGWAIEAATGYQREHDDTDISVLSTDVPAFVDHLRGRWHVWNNVGGVLHPLGDRWTTVDEPRSQLWLRANASAPWVLDVPLTPAANGGRWTNKHLDGHVATVEEVTWVAEDAIRYLLPEIVLVFKARLRRPKDEPDFEATLRSSLRSGASGCATG